MTAYVEPPAWWRYRNEPAALYAMIVMHREEIERDPGRADWYRGQIAEIDAHLKMLCLVHHDQPVA